MWSSLLAPGLGLLDGPAAENRALAQELTHHVVHGTLQGADHANGHEHEHANASGNALGSSPSSRRHRHRGEGYVLWIDGDHGFNPYDLAELNLVRGRAADEGASRVLIKRCMTPFQWDTVLTRHLDDKLAAVDTDLVLVLPYDRLFSTDELKDWEQEDYVAYSLGHLEDLATEHGVPVLLGAHMARWHATHPRLAQLTRDAVTVRWPLEDAATTAEAWETLSKARTAAGGVVRQATILEWMTEDEVSSLGHPS